MARRFEDLIIWQKSRKLVSDCFDLVELEVMQNRWSFNNQLTRASLSVMNNIAEGFERGRKKEFIHFLKVSKASAAEVRSMFYVMLDRNWISVDDFETLRQQVIDVASGIQGLIRHLDESDFGNAESNTIRDDLVWTTEDFDESLFDLKETDR